MKLAVIYVVYDQSETEVKDFENHIKRLNLRDYKIYRIDNGKDNRGYAAGVNAGLKQGLSDGADIFIVANTDITLSDFTEKIILAPQESFDIWGFGFRQKGKTYYGGGLDSWRMSASLEDKKPKARFAETSFVSGSFMVIKREVVEKIGLWEEDYFLYYEDVDYCVRAKRAGFKVGIDSTVLYDHHEVSTTVLDRKKYYLATSRIKFFLSFSSLKQKIYEMIRLPKTVIEEFHILPYALKHNPFLVNFLSLNASSLMNKFMSFVLFLVLVRTVSVSDYGIYSLVWAQVALFGPLVDFGTTSYGIVHLGSGQTKKLNDLFSFRLFLAVAVFLLTIALSFFMKFSSRLIFFIFLTSFSIFATMFSGSYLILTSLLQKLYASSLLSVGFNFVLISSLIISLLTTHSIGSIFWIIFIVYSGYAFVNAIRIKSELGKLKFDFHPGIWIEIAKKSYIYVLIGLFASLYFKIDVFILQFFKGEAAVGIYSAGYKFLDALILIAASYNISATPLLASLRKKSLHLMISRMKKDLIFLTLIGGVISFGIFICAPYLLPLVLKDAYIHSITVLRIAIFALPLILLTSVFLNALYVMNKAYIVVGVFFVQAIVNGMLNFIFIPHYSYIAASYITVLSELINLALVATFFIYSISKNHEHIA